MKKSSTVTYYAEYNYGAVLQAYSLQNYLLNNGVENEIIHLKYASQMWKNKIFSRRFTARAIVKNIIKFANLRSIVLYRKKMKNFVNENLKLTRPYESYQDLLDNGPQSDFYFCGSDQIWNVSKKIRKEFFLEFVKTGKKIAYAPSIAVHNIDDYSEHYFKTQLSAFSAISVREQSGLDILNYAGITNCSVCMDPVFLHSKEFWMEKCKNFTEQTPRKKYILVYSLDDSPELLKTLRHLADTKKLPIYVITTDGFTKIKNCKKISKASPLEFLNLILNAEYVVSSSFHGLAFSLIFDKKFLAYANKVSGSRTKDLLTRVGLDENLIEKDIDIAVADTIQYDSVHKKMQYEISQSEKFIKDALNE